MVLWYLYFFSSTSLSLHQHQGHGSRIPLDSGGVAYDYSHHGQDWVQGSCASRERQSPINFADLSSPPSGSFSYVYRNISSAFSLINTGHTLAGELVGEGYGGVTLEGEWYNLLSINFHSKSEHSFQNNRYPLEVHLVHKRYDSDALLVVALPFRPHAEGGGMHGMNSTAPLVKKNVSSDTNISIAESDSSAPGFSSFLDFLLGKPLPDVNEEIAVDSISELSPLDLNNLLGNSSFLEYPGSLTAPPCSENALWLVRRDPLEASNRQVATLVDALMSLSADFGNFRSAMPLNGRSVVVKEAVYEEPPPQKPAVRPPSGQHTPREYKALRWARDALRISKMSMDYMKNIDMRLKAAARAHAQNMDHIVDMNPTNQTAPPPSSPPSVSPAIAEAGLGELSGVAQKVADAVAEAAGKALQDSSMTSAGPSSNETAQQNMPQPPTAPPPSNASSSNTYALYIL